MSSLNYGPVMVTDPGLGCPVVVAAGRVSPAHGDTQAPLFVSGWGTSFEEAARNCRHEADEAFYSQFFAPERVVRARAAELQGRVVAPTEMLLFSDDQYRGRRRWNRRHKDAHRVPARWDSRRRIDWVSACAGDAGAPAWLPARLCVTRYQGDSASGLPQADSNGLATGSSTEDAAVRGFLELVERDATAIWWYNRLVPPRLDPQSLSDDLVRDYQAWLQAGNRQLRLLRLTLDLFVPVVAAISHDIGGRHVAFGFSAARSEREAARRAVGELAQCEANLALLNRRAAGSGTAEFTPGARRLHDWHQAADIGRQPHLSGGSIVGSSPRALDIDWRRCATICRERGLELFRVDLTHRDSGPVVRVAVPGLCSTKPRFGGERLGGVPARMGLKPGPPGLIDETPFPV